MGHLEENLPLFEARPLGPNPALPPREGASREGADLSHTWAPAVLCTGHTPRPQPPPGAGVILPIFSWATKARGAVTCPVPPRAPGTAVQSTVLGGTNS